MNLTRRVPLASLALLCALAAPFTPATVRAQPVAARVAADPPPIQRELRGVWIATVANIDWPSKPGLSTWEQQAELVALLNRAVAMHMNALVLQVRPQADALYASELEPWSPFLTGVMGRAPEPFYDPLTFAVEQAHARGLELHAWFNPYRALSPQTVGDAAPSHVTRAQPSLIRSYGTQTWLDPADSSVESRSVRAILDVVRRYDVDGVHIDDYFYPYREADRSGRTIDFPDQAAYDAYRRAGGKLPRNDWRRENVNRFVERLGKEVHLVKPWVRFGVSPFGIWRPGYPASVRGLDSYEEIFADSRKWLTEGWVDYLAPQLYWPLGRPQQDYSTLLSWWVSQNAHGRHIWPGLNAGLSSSTPPKGRGTTELVEQIRLTRALAGATGEIFFSAKVFMQNPDSVVERLTRDAYATPALVPASPWLDPRVPLTPVIEAHVDPASGAYVLVMDPGGDDSEPWLWVVQARTAFGWTTDVIPGGEMQHLLAGRGAAPPSDVRVSAVSRTGVMSPAARLAPSGAVAAGAVRSGGR